MFWICHYFPHPVYSIMYLKLVGPVHLRINRSDHPNAIIEYPQGVVSPSLLEPDGIAE